MLELNITFELGTTLERERTLEAELTGELGTTLEPGKRLVLVERLEPTADEAGIELVPRIAEDSGVLDAVSSVSVTEE